MGLGGATISLYEVESPRVFIRAYSMKDALNIYNLWLKKTKREIGEPISIKYLGSELTMEDVFE